jgi:hypothetical protein
LVAGTILIAMYLRFDISGAAANPSATKLFIRLAARLSKDDGFTRLIRGFVFGLTKLRKHPLFKAVAPFLESAMNSLFLIYAMIFVAAHRTGLIQGAVMQKLRLSRSADKAHAIWAVVLETAAAFLVVLYLAVAWLALSSRSIKLFTMGALVVVAAVDWQVVRRVSPQLVEPVRTERMNWRFLVFAAVVVAIGAGAFLGDLPQVSIGRFGAPLVLLSAIAFWVATWTLVSMAALRGPSMRVVALATGGIAVLLFLTGPYNEATVRAISSSKEPAPNSLENYIDQWLETRRPEIERQSGKYAVIVVAAEGGGIRAAYWAGTILAALHDRDPCISDHMLAISGVSGGSIGAGVYSAVVATEARAFEPCEAGHRALLRKVQAILGTDLLSAQLGGALVSDGIRSIVQSNLLPTTWRVAHFPDRSTVFDVNLEAASKQATGDEVMERSWAQPWAGSYHRSMPPLVIPNMTAVENGERVVLTPFSTPHDWPHALDAGRYADVAHMRFSTAIFLSARFPAISPTARLGEASGALRVVDGGYGDNSGTATARSIGALLMRIAARKGLAPRIRPVFLILTNGETVSSPEKALWAATPLGTIFDPATTLIGVGTSSSARYRDELACAIAPWDGDIVDDFKLDYQHTRLPLGWMLAPATRETLDTRLEELLNVQSVSRHIAALTHDTPVALPDGKACTE